MSRPPRFRRFSYLGRYRYLLTFCTIHRARLFEDPRPIVRYILVENPVHANLARTTRDYPFARSDLWNLADLL
jgi:hypothetical protein